MMENAEGKPQNFPTLYQSSKTKMILKLRENNGDWSCCQRLKRLRWWFLSCPHSTFPFDSTKIISSKKKKFKKAKWLSEEALQIAVKRREVKSKGEKEIYTHLNAEFQRTARRDKKAFLSDQCEEIEENNRMGKTRDLFKKSTLAWRIPWTEEPVRLQSMGSLRVRHDWATSLSLFTFMHWRRKWQPAAVFLPGESQRRGILVGCCLWGRTEPDTTEVTWHSIA